MVASTRRSVASLQLLQPKIFLYQNIDVLSKTFLFTVNFETKYLEAIWVCGYAS
jgi:hypothetical protein